MVEQTGFEHTEVAGSPAEVDSPAAPTKAGPKPRGETGQSGRLTQDQLDFIDFLLTPADERPISQNEWERTHGYGAGTCSRWKNTNVGFRAALQRRFDEYNRNPERIQEAVAALHRAGVTKLDTKALMDYLRYVGAYTDKQITETVARPTDMTDDELVAELREELAILEAKQQLGES